MFKIVQKSIQWGGRTLTLETGKMARQADGAVLAKYGNSTVLCTIVSDKKSKEGINFLPLTVHYREMAYSAGKIPGGFFKREGRSSEKEVLTSRLIDRPIRPLFPDNFYHETQVICTVLSHDGVNDTEILALIAASAAIAISGIPFDGPIGAANVGYHNGEFILNPTIQEGSKQELDLVVAGTKDSVMMVESEAKELSEEIMLEAVAFGHEQFRTVISMIAEFAEEVGLKEQMAVTVKDNSDLFKSISTFAEARVKAAYTDVAKQSRNKKIAEIEAEVSSKFIAEGFVPLDISTEFKHLKAQVVRNNVLDSNLRIDGRDSKTIRSIVTEVGLLPKTHGSALFTRGETQALVVSTLGTTQDEQIIDSLEGESRENFMLHYNFLPYCVGETTPLKAPGRREIGHGKLAWRAMKAVLPEKADFPYTIRVVSEITECNGSSSMATICGASMSMMDAGIPIRKPVAGIAMGLIKENDKFVVLSDIMGDEDHLGDMDFKVAGTNAGITALQMDIKISGISADIMKAALEQAKEGRIHILGKMAESIEEGRTTLNENAPNIITIQINKDKIKEVIGSGGSVIKKICEVSGAKIDIDNDGTIKIAANNSQSSDLATKMIQDIVLEAEVGQTYEGRVVKVLDFGAFVNFIGNKDGLVHISELTDTRVESVTDVVKEGDVVKVLVVGVDSKGKVKLSMRAVDQETGELNHNYSSSSNDSSDASRAKKPSSSSRPPRTGDRNDKFERKDRDGYNPEKRKYFQ
jgi:polyribonucleotide nucleotidyltransferase